ncbi:MAG: hypothetical protein R2749_26005 [Acidimicrobiales bacterium]
MAPLLQAVTLLCLPDGPDGRELGPLLAHRLRRPYLANVLAAGNGAVRCVAGGATEVLAIDTPPPSPASSGSAARGLASNAGRRHGTTRCQAASAS